MGLKKQLLEIEDGVDELERLGYTESADLARRAAAYCREAYERWERTFGPD